VVVKDGVVKDDAYIWKTKAPFSFAPLRYPSEPGIKPICLPLKRPSFKALEDYVFFQRNQVPGSPLKYPLPFRSEITTPGVRYCLLQHTRPNFSFNYLSSQVSISLRFGTLNSR